MDFINVLTTNIRDELVNEYMNLQEKFFHYGKDLELVNNFEDEFYDDFESEIFLKIYDYVLKSPYKNIIFLILINDSYNYLSEKDNLIKYEKNTLKYINSNDIATIFERLILDKQFFIEMSVLFFEYNFDMDQKRKDHSSNHKQLKYFKLFMLDKMQIEINKRGY